MKDDLANEDLAHLRAATEPKDDMLKRETPLPKASPVCPVCGIAVPHAHDYAGLMTLIVKQKNELTALEAKAQLADEFLEEIKNNWPDWSPMNSPAEIIVDLINERAEKIDEREAIHAMCVCMAARLEDCAKALEDQAEVCRATGYFDGALTVNEFAAAARKIIKEWEEL